MNKFIFSILLAGFVSSCTLNMMLTDTHGRADDVVDADPQNNPTISPNITVPVKPL